MSIVSDPMANVAGKQRLYAFNSTVLYLLAYFILYCINQLVTVFMARSNRIPTELFPGHIEFRIPDNAWQVSQVVSTYGPGPIVCLAIAILSVVIFNLVKRQGGLRKLFYLWLLLHGFNFFFGSLIAGTVARSGFWYAVRWSIPSDAGTIALAAGCGLALLLIGFLMAPGFLLSCDSITLIEFSNRKKLLNAMILLPWFAGTLILLLLKLPDLKTYEMLQHLTMLLLLLPAYGFNLGNLFSETVDTPQRPQLASGLAIGLLVLLVAFRLMLQNGMHFG